MGKRDPGVDAYIDQAADFAQPILKHLRELVHTGCPAVEETLKWRQPCFVHKGILCGLAAFKQHCTFGFWKYALIFGPARRGQDQGNPAAGPFDRITALSDLPADEVILGYIKEAVRLNEAGIQPPRPKPKERKELVVPDALTAALKQNPAARETFEKFSPSHRREYVEWLTEAKTEATRQKRLATALAWLAEGKPRNWKYMNC